MNAERLLAHYEQIADAPDAIARLRRFILDLAVRGKLVPQDPNDEPASELLKRIAKEKARLVKAGEIRKPKARSDDRRGCRSRFPSIWRWARRDLLRLAVLEPRNECSCHAACRSSCPNVTDRGHSSYDVANWHESDLELMIEGDYRDFAEGDVASSNVRR